MPFQSTETVTQGQVTVSIIRDMNNNFVPNFNVILSSITSDLLVVNIQYPNHDGVYTCIGSNDISMVNISRAMTNIQVIGKHLFFYGQNQIPAYIVQFYKVPPEVEVIASASQVILEGSTKLFCNVTRTNPAIVDAYVWTNENMGKRIHENSDTLQLSLSAVNDFGTYSCMVRNTAGEVGIGNVTITRQECKDINNRIKVLLEQLGFKL